jgi:anti-anti-sigma regulatory factor
MAEATLKTHPVWQLYVPKLVTLMRRGYGLKDFQSDFVAGLTVAIVALLNQFPKSPRAFILRMGQVPLIDASAATALRQLIDRCARAGTQVIFSGLLPQPRDILIQMGICPDGKHLQFAENFEEAESSRKRAALRDLSPRGVSFGAAVKRLLGMAC